MTARTLDVSLVHCGRSQGSTLPPARPTVGPPRSSGPLSSTPSPPPLPGNPSPTYCVVSSSLSDEDIMPSLPGEDSYYSHNICLRKQSRSEVIPLRCPVVILHCLPPPRFPVCVLPQTLICKLLPGSLSPAKAAARVHFPPSCWVLRRPSGDILFICFSTGSFSPFSLLSLVELVAFRWQSTSPHLLPLLHCFISPSSQGPGVPFSPW